MRNVRGLKQTIHSEPGYRKKSGKNQFHEIFHAKKFREITFSNKFAILLSNYVKNDDKHPSEIL